MEVENGSSGTRAPTPLTRRGMVMCTHTPNMIVLLLLSLACLPTDSQAQSSAVAFFAQPVAFVTGAQRSSQQRASLPIGTTQVSVNTDIFDLQPGHELILGLPNLDELTIVFDRILQHDSGNRTWVGHLREDPLFRVLLTGSGTIYSGSINLPGKTYSIRYENGTTVLLDFEAAGLAQLPLIDDALFPPPPRETDLRQKKFEVPPMMEEAAQTVIDVMILYSPGIAGDFPGNALQTEIDRIMALTNTAYSDSSITTTLRIVKVEAVNYADSGGNSAALTALSDNVGVFAGVASTRDSVGADLVILLRKFALDSVSCGVAWTLLPSHLNTPSFIGDNFAYGVVSLGSVGSTFCTDATYAHEIGHLMGSGHDWNVQPSGGNVSPYAIGHFSQNAFGTIMSTTNLGVRVFLFSNPELMQCGNPAGACGIVIGALNEADNRSAFNSLTNPMLAAYRATVVNADGDGDGIPDADDAFPDVNLGGRTDTDGDGAPDECDQTCIDLGMSADSDDDGDGVLDANDLFPLISLGGLMDTDGDGAPNLCDEACLDSGMTADTDTADFVTRFYIEVLNRAPDSVGLADWVNKLQTTERTGADIAFGFIFSQEFIDRNLNDSDYLDILYRAFFNRAPDTGGKSSWQTLIDSGASRNDVLQGFTGSQEFTNLSNSFGITPRRTSVELFVIRFYNQILLRDADVVGLADWATQLNNKTKTGADIANGFVFSQEFLNRNLSDVEFVTVLYRAFFGREPDQGGLDGWLLQLNGGASRQVVLIGFLGAQEFINLANSFGITAS